MTVSPIDSLAVPGVDALVAGYAEGTLRPADVLRAAYAAIEGNRADRERGRHTRDEGAEDGGTVKGFGCEGHAVEEAEDISAYGGWRAYRDARKEETT